MVGLDEVGIDLASFRGLVVGVDRHPDGPQGAAQLDLVGADGGDLRDGDDAHRQHREDPGGHHQLDEGEAALALGPEGPHQNWGTEARLKSGR